MTDPIGDMLTRIRNGYLARKKMVKVPYSRIKEQMAEILVKEGYLAKLKVRSEKFKILELGLKYEGKKPALTSIERVSKPGLRIYSPAKKIKQVCSGLGLSILSTSAGLMTNKEARKKNLGGEIICQVW